MAKEGFDYKQYLKWVNNIGVTKEHFDLWLKTFLLQQAQRVVRNTKLLTPVDTGALRASWSIGNQHIYLTETGDKTSSGKNVVDVDLSKSDIASVAIIGDTLSVEIYSNLDYASFVEYGHHSYKGKFMLTISIDKVQKALPKRFEKEFQAFLQSGGVI